MKQLPAGFFLVLMLVTLGARCEVISGMTDVYDKLNGSPNFILYDSTDVYTWPVENKWSRIMVVAYVDEQHFSDYLHLKRKTSLYNSFGKLIGLVTQNFQFMNGYRVEGQRVALELIGYVYSNKVAPSSIVEYSIQSLIKTSQPELHIGEFKQHLADFGYENTKKDENFSIWVNHEKDNFRGHFTAERLKLVFYKDVLTIIYTSRHVELTHVESEVREPNRKIIYLKNLSGESANKLSIFMNAGN